MSERRHGRQVRCQGRWDVDRDAGTLTGTGMPGRCQGCRDVVRDAGMLTGMPGH